MSSYEFLREKLQRKTQGLVWIIKSYEGLHNCCRKTRSLSLRSTVLGSFRAFRWQLRRSLCVALFSTFQDAKTKKTYSRKLPENRPFENTPRTVYKSPMLRAERAKLTTYPWNWGYFRGSNFGPNFLGMDKLLRSEISLDGKSRRFRRLLCSWSFFFFQIFAALRARGGWPVWSAGWSTGHSARAGRR